MLKNSMLPPTLEMLCYPIYINGQIGMMLRMSIDGSSYTLIELVTSIALIGT
jgi:hypothetical protein